MPASNLPSKPPISRNAWLSTIRSSGLDEVLALNEIFKKDDRQDKVNLGIGIYRDNDGHAWPLASVASAEAQLLESNNSLRHEYPPTDGDPRFLELSRNLCFGEVLSGVEKPLADNSIVSVQTLSGTGANHVGAVFLAKHLRPGRVWLSDPTWQNHHQIFESVGIPRVTYPYFNSATRRFDFARAMKVFEAELREGDVVVLQACAHNPTGQDPSRGEWRAIAELCNRKRAFPFFDCAYQGFASGDPYEDAWAIRHFRETYPAMPMMVAQSFSKNFGLYGQRAGALHFCVGGLSAADRADVRASLCTTMRLEYSFPPRHGAALVTSVLGDRDLAQQWLADLRVMSGRIREMRTALHAELTRLRTPGTWDHIVTQIGMFSYTGLGASEADELRGRYHIYMTRTGRISMSGLTTHNVEHVARAIDDVVRQYKGQVKL